MDNDDGSSFALCSIDGIRSRSLADVSVANDESKMLPTAAPRLVVVLAIERRGEDVTGRGA